MFLSGDVTELRHRGKTSDVPSRSNAQSVGSMYRFKYIFRSIIFNSDNTLSQLDFRLILIFIATLDKRLGILSQ